MNYQTYQPNAYLNSLVKCFWTLEVPAEYSSEKQRIIPDGCMELIFILGDDIKRYTSEDEFIIQPRAIVVGQITEPFTIQPVGYVHCFATRFYPYGLANFIPTTLKNLENKETPFADLLERTAANDLEQKIIHAADTQERIELIEAFLLNKLNEKTTIDAIVKSTVDALMATSGSVPINAILKEDPSKRRQLERNFLKQIGVSPKQLGKMIRLQTALKLMLNQKTETFTEIAYESEYYDQNHFIKDFREFTGITPREFLSDEQMRLSSIFYSKD
ncbi:AraC family transcriptional regulator [Algoriphagus terrigena]|uniref:AraC family transcriptional regulator n=1 Tax=Algoriphagus terrigena TaxID=344884 RepID=UPI0004140CDA|nr:AraC family transcriptional regulator [Algoriphagus terrigena]